MTKKKVTKKKASTKKTPKKTTTKKTTTKKTSANKTVSKKKPARRGLSRGLGALLSNSRSTKEQPKEPPVKVSISVDATESSSQASANSLHGQLTHLPIEKLQRGRYQPRQVINQEPLQELAESIKAQGIMQPIVVRAVAKGQYEIIAGERRWRAAQLAMLESVPVIIRNIADEDAIAMALIENIQRENLNAVEEATAIHRLIEEFELTHDEAAQAIGRSRASVTNLLRLLELNPSVKDLLAQNKISMGHARAILALDQGQQLAVARDVATKGLSVRGTEALVRQIQNPKQKTKANKATKNADIQRLEHDLTDRLGARVSIDDKKGKGKLVIEYNSLDELDGILEKIR